MKRSATVTILGCIICLIVALLAGAQAPPQSDARKKASPPKVQTKPPWKTLKTKANRDKPIKAIQAFTTTDCPVEEKNRKREVAILGLDANRYQEFQADPRGFVNSYPIFSCDVRSMEHLSGSTKSKAAPPGGDPTLTVVHEPNCVGLWYD